jgi:hypothetical protein
MDAAAAIAATALLADALPMVNPIRLARNRLASRPSRDFRAGFSSRRDASQ